MPLAAVINFISVVGPLVPTSVIEQSFIIKEQRDNIRLVSYEVDVPT